ncbi:MAG: Rieske (2Fe-2S) protein [Alphaproteobacteria bacterium]|nr:Rieske (2Fe-2S) protein [Alphaproteobacteria bacterium]
MSTETPTLETPDHNAGQWVPLARIQDFAGKDRIIIRHEGKQIVVFQTDNGLHAIDNRCPHEGYPLREGTLGKADGRCVITCNWHNWKFDLTTGDNLYGGDKVRAYPVRVEGDEVLLDLTDPPPAVKQRQALDNLTDAMDDNDSERLFREVARLERAGADPMDAIRHGIRMTFDKLEFGFGHAYAAAADWLAIRDRFPDSPDIRLACLVEPLAHMADDTVREETYAYPDVATEWDADAFVAAVDAEDEAAATGHLRAGLRDGVSLDALRHVFARTGLLHYAAFGHAVIYVTKAFELIERLGAPVTEPLLLALMRHHLRARREDLIPEFRDYAGALTEMRTAAGGPLPTPEDYRSLNVKKALSLTARCGLGDPEGLFRVLLEANAWNTAAFDVSWMAKKDVKPDNSVNWLDNTHGITFSEAVLALCRRYPDLWAEGLLQMACFVGRNAAYTRPGVPGDMPAEMTEEWYPALLESMIDHGQDAFIVAAHVIKTPTAAEALRRQGFGSPILAHGVNRFLAGPLDLRQVRRTAKQALAFVALDS